MNIHIRTLSLALAGLCMSAAAIAAGPGGIIQVSDQRRSDLRGAVEAHRTSVREEQRREEAAAGRRLTPAELAQLRQQVRQQWQSAESMPAERMLPTPSVGAASPGSARGPRQ